MKKILSLAIFCLAISNLSFGQFKLIQQGDSVMINDSTITVYGNATTPMISPNINVINLGIDTIAVYARMDSISTPAHFGCNYFCWVLCYDSSKITSPYTETLNRWGTAGDTSNPSFQGHYAPEGHLGTATVRYTFFAARNHLDSAWVIVKYIATPAAVQSVSGKEITFSAYPNPAANTVNFNYTLINGANSANLKIYNLLGECVQTLPLNTSKSKTTIDVQSIPSGIYVCEIEASGYQSSYQKLVVTH